MRAAVAIVLAALGPLACQPDDEEGCATVQLDCAPQYEPTFDNVFEHTLRPTCGVGAGSCHATEGAKAGLVFEDPDEAFALLTGGSAPAVVGGDAACSTLAVRLIAPAEDAMPPGAPLDEPEQCAILQWIDQGAQR